MKDMLKMGLFLFIIAAIAGVMLAITEEVTAPKIAANKQRKLEEARKEVLPVAVAFSQQEKTLENKDHKITYNAGFNEKNELAGVVLTVYPKGYAGPIETVVGLDTNGKITGVKILSQKETPGLGTKLADPVFLEPFKKLLENKDSPVFLLKQDGGDVDGITAATISSRAFCAGIRNSLSLFNSIKPELSSLQPPQALPASTTGGVQ